MESKRRRQGSILAAVLIAALFSGGCTEPRQDTPAEQIEQQTAHLSPLNSEVQPVFPTTEQSVHVGDDEFEVSGPYTHANLEVFLLHNSAQRAAPRKILTLEEALAQNKVKVHETGNVQELAIENLTDDVDIYVQSGDIVRGGKQDRVLSMDILVQPKSGKLPLASFCVEQGRWSARTSFLAPNVSAFSFSGFASSNNSVSSKELKKAVRLAKSQQSVWAEVSNAQAMLSSNIGASVASPVSASSLELTLSGEKVQQAVAKYKKALGSIVEDRADAVGFAFAINGKLNSAEVYSSNSLFSRLWGKMLQASAVEAVSVANESKGTEKPTSPTAVRAFLAVEKGAKGRSQQINARMQLLTVDGKDVVFSETRDKQADSAWIHRSYVAR